MNTTNDADTPRTNDPKANPDPITKAPGAHPVSTGAGALSAGLAGAAIGTMAGPVGSVAGGIAGAVIGAVGGGLIGKGAGEALNPTTEATYWRDNHAKQPYAQGSTYDNYENAYRVGYEGQSKHGAKYKSFDEAEASLRDEYGTGNSSVDWDRARPAASAAWKRRADSMGN